MALHTRPAVASPGDLTGPGSFGSVNLMPAETVERNRARAIARRFVLAGIGLTVVGAGVWLAQAQAIQAAQGELAAAEIAHADTRARLAPLQPIKAFSATLDQQQGLVGSAMVGHTSFSRALGEFGAAWPEGSSLRTLEATLGPGCAGPDPFQPAPAIGCVTWSVTVPGEQQVRDLTAALATAPGFVSPYLTDAARNEETFEAGGTVNIDERLLSGRFADLVEGVGP